MLYLHFISSAIIFPIVRDSMEVSKVVDRSAESVLLLSHRNRLGKGYNNMCDKRSTRVLHHVRDKTSFHHYSDYASYRVYQFLRVGLLKFMA